MRRSWLTACMGATGLSGFFLIEVCEAQSPQKLMRIPPPSVSLVDARQDPSLANPSNAGTPAVPPLAEPSNISGPFPGPGQDPKLDNDRLLDHTETAAEDLLQERERAAIPYPRPDISTPAERVVPIPITPPPDSFSGFIPESPGDWNLPEPRRTYPLPVPKPSPGMRMESAGNIPSWQSPDAMYASPWTQSNESLIHGGSFSGQFGSLLDRRRGSAPGLPYIPSLSDSRVALSNYVPPQQPMPSPPAPRRTVNDVHTRLQERHWQFHLAKTLPMESSETPSAMSSLVCEVPYQPNDFSNNPFVPAPQNPYLEIETYYGKVPVDVQRPWVEWWRPFYTGGMYEPGVPVFSDVNLLTPSFLVYGDYRTGVGVHRNQGQQIRNWAHRLNLDMDLRFTGTERFHMFAGPLDHNGRFTRLDFSNGRTEFEEELDFQPDTAFFEGDLGAITGSWIGTDAPFDLPFTCGLIPLLYQNGIWMEDAIAGLAFGSPWRHNKTLNWANFDATFFAGFNQVTSPAFQNDNNAAAIYGTAWFVEAYHGYIEMDYAYLDDLDELGRSYHNAAIAYTRRYFGRISNSIRLIGNAGQSGPANTRSADGGLLIIENSLISSQPSTFVPYMNMFVGSGRPQSVARAGNAGGILRNVGINFETDGLTGYPTLDASGSNSYGGAVGLNMLSADFRRQWVVEFAALDTYGDPVLSSAAGPEYALGTRYQRTINNRCLWRVDFMNGMLDNASDIYGTRAEFRWKF